MANFYQVGGCVRDRILGLKPKDIDFSVEAESYEDMKAAILERGCRIFLETPQYFTIRANDKMYGSVDFVLCRKESGYSDGRRPDVVEVGTLLDDLSRRDFTMNAMAEDDSGNIIDPFNGQKDIAASVIRCVGEAEDRLSEDALRMVRAIRFSVTKSMVIHNSIQNCLRNPYMVCLIQNVSVDRIREELAKAFQFSTVHTLALLDRFPLLRNACFYNGLKLMPTTKKNF